MPPGQLRDVVSPVTVRHQKDLDASTLRFQTAELLPLSCRLRYRWGLGQTFTCTLRGQHHCLIVCLHLTSIHPYFHKKMWQMSKGIFKPDTSPQGWPFRCFSTWYDYMKYFIPTQKWDGPLFLSQKSSHTAFILLVHCNHLLFYSIVIWCHHNVLIIRVNSTIVALIKEVLVFLICFLMKVLLLNEWNKVFFFLLPSFMTKEIYAKPSHTILQLSREQYENVWLLQ